LNLALEEYGALEGMIERYHKEAREDYHLAIGFDFWKERLHEFPEKRQTGPDPCLDPCLPAFDTEALLKN